MRYPSGFDGFNHVTMYKTVYFLNIQKQVAKLSEISILYLLYCKTSIFRNCYMYLIGQTWNIICELCLPACMLIVLSFTCLKSSFYFSLSIKTKDTFQIQFVSYIDIRFLTSRTSYGSAYIKHCILWSSTNACSLVQLFEPFILSYSGWFI